MQSGTFYRVLLGLLSLTSDTAKVRKIVPPPAPVVYNYDSATAVQEYIANKNLEFLQELNKK